MNDYLRLSKPPSISWSAPTCSTCGVDLEWDDGDDGFLAGYWCHVAIVTEVAVRQQLAAEVWALEHDADTMRREVWEGKLIMWVQGWDAAVLTAGRIVHGEPILAARGRS